MTEMQVLAIYGEGAAVVFVVMLFVFGRDLGKEFRGAESPFTMTYERIGMAAFMCAAVWPMLLALAIGIGVPCVISTAAAWCACRILGKKEIQ
jgi:hypothetical protein